jgi:sec-independent protein translocase protein TatB
VWRVFGINLGEFSILIVIALIVIGPERLPKYAQQLGTLVRDGRKMAMNLREQVREELGPEFDEVDWRKLDPRQYDPRRIVREALADVWDDGDDPFTPPSSPGPAAAAAAAASGGVTPSPAEWLAQPDAEQAAEAAAEPAAEATRTSVRGTPIGEDGRPVAPTVSLHKQREPASGGATSPVAPYDAEAT